jgi:hypothetical protein
VGLTTCCVILIRLLLGEQLKEEQLVLFVGPSDCSEASSSQPRSLPEPLLTMQKSWGKGFETPG